LNELLDQVLAAPGVDSAGTAGIVPLAGNSWNDMVEISGVQSHDRMLACFNRVSPGYFKTLGATLLSGRDFDGRDTTSSPEAAIVNQEFCRKFLAGANPLGRQVRLMTGPGEAEHRFQVVGLVIANSNSTREPLQRPLAGNRIVYKRCTRIEFQRRRSICAHNNMLQVDLSQRRHLIRQRQPEFAIGILAFDAVDKSLGSVVKAQQLRGEFGG
jgi:hypothetical protein